MKNEKVSLLREKNMKKVKLFSMLLLATLILMPAVGLYTNTTHIAYAADTVKVVVVTAHNEGDPTAQGFKDNLTAWGFTVVEADTEINSSILEGAQILMMGSPYFGANYTSAEIQAVVNWFNEGGKTIWVAGDSDYEEAGGKYFSNNTNWVLEAIGSHLRVEPASVEDPESNAGASYRVVANVTNTEDEVTAPLVENVSKVLCHGPTFLYGVLDDGTPVALENTTIENVHWVLKTSPAGVVVENDPTKTAVAHEVDQVGSFVVVAIEMYAGPKGNNKIIVSGAAPYGDYRPLITPEYHDVQLDGIQFMHNMMNWAKVVEEKPMDWTLYGIAGAVVAVVIVVVVLLMKKK